MEKNNKAYELIRELILLGFYARKNFQGNQMSLGEYQYKDKKYEIYSSWVSESQTSIFIKCGNEIIHLTIEDDLSSRRFGGWVSNDVYFHLNKYKDIDVKDVVYYYPLYGLDKMSKENVIYKSKVIIDYSRSDCIYTNPNRPGTRGFKAEKFIFNRPDYFDKKLENGKYIEVFKDAFSPKIILNLIEQIYPNFEQININNKIDRIIKSLSQDELLTLKERLLEQEQQKRVLSKENIELLFKNQDFKYIIEAVWKCDQNLNVELLNFISINTQKLMSNPNANIFNKEQLKKLIKKTGEVPGHMSTMSYEELVECYNDDIIRCCEQILIDIILVSSDNYEYFGHILEQLYKNENANVRLYCCANGNYTIFLNDPSTRVAKVANIRYNFDKKWNCLTDDDNEKQRLDFLIYALENGKIGYFNHDVLIKDADDKSSISFRSVLFEETKSRIFDNDILCTIGDRRILADAINELIKRGELILNYDMAPECFKNEHQQEQSGQVLIKKNNSIKEKRK